ncbi:hypothetical protein CYMTET_38174 [Cymbomonas tetramitiformis]|uniref:SWIM-type domain-containing protein n=1 Tax=Cymbomonas tetramitiformis TaxID=36881 RepID=A0AAE0CE98_9CHLO|nr:hypothetical protein CYMTET_38174 [Cymbomonas tetramitiformis]
MPGRSLVADDEILETAPQSLQVEEEAVPSAVRLESTVSVHTVHNKPRYPCPVQFTLNSIQGQVDAMRIKKGMELMAAVSELSVLEPDTDRTQYHYSALVASVDTSYQISFCVGESSILHKFRCNCLDSKSRSSICKHILSVALLVVGAPFPSGNPVDLRDEAPSSIPQKRSHSNMMRTEEVVPILTFNNGPKITFPLGEPAEQFISIEEAQSLLHFNPVSTSFNKESTLLMGGTRAAAGAKNMIAYKLEAIAQVCKKNNPPTFGEIIMKLDYKYCSLRPLVRKSKKYDDWYAYLGCMRAECHARIVMSGSAQQPPPGQQYRVHFLPEISCVHFEDDTATMGWLRGKARYDAKEQMSGSKPLKHHKEQMRVIDKDIKESGIFADFTGDLAKQACDDLHKPLNGMISVATPEDMQMHPIAVLETVTTDSRHVSFEDSLNKFRAAEKDIFGNNVEPPIINTNCGLNLLLSFLNVFLKEAWETYDTRVRAESITDVNGQGESNAQNGIDDATATMQASMATPMDDVVITSAHEPAAGGGGTSDADAATTIAAGEGISEHTIGIGFHSAEECAKAFGGIVIEGSLLVNSHFDVGAYLAFYENEPSLQDMLWYPVEVVDIDPPSGMVTIRYFKGHLSVDQANKETNKYKGDIEEMVYKIFIVKDVEEE